MLRANSTDVDPCVAPPHPRGNSTADATEPHVPVIAFPKSDSVEVPGPGDPYGDIAMARLRHERRAARSDPRGRLPGLTLEDLA
jgi:hypothetical protein